MVKDRLQEMQEKREEYEKQSKKKKKKEKSEDNGDMNVFIDKVNMVENQLEELKKDVAQIKKTQSNLYCSPFVTTANLQDMESKADSIISSSSKIRKDIELIAAENFPKSQKDSLLNTSTQERVHTSQVERLQYELREAMNDFRTSQADYVEKTRARFRRQMEIVKDSGEINGNEQGDNFQNQALFTGNIILEMQQAKGELQMIDEREQELQHLESQIHEVNKLFKEMHVLVEEQGEMVDNIEKNIEQAVDDVEKGKGQLTEAEKNQKKARKKKICCVSIVAVILIIVIIIVVIMIMQNTE
ncbi:syntaxin-like [Mytilus californianus]|uniref:syntaxin-like n=1 Tax=Mytilus californianus TaxID=6549 RepID=UPI002246F881|nr:syntaxin-like [Mytilus californianus]